MVICTCWVGYHLATHLARVGLTLVYLKFSPNSTQVFPNSTRAKSMQTDRVRNCISFFMANEWFSCELGVHLATRTQVLILQTWVELGRVGNTVWPGLYRHSSSFELLEACDMLALITMVQKQLIRCATNLNLTLLCMLFLQPIRIEYFCIYIILRVPELGKS